MRSTVILLLSVPTLGMKLFLFIKIYNELIIWKSGNKNRIIIFN